MQSCSYNAIQLIANNFVEYKNVGAISCTCTICHICRKNAPWISVENPYAKERDADIEKAFQLWDELRSSQVRVTAERVKGICLHTLCNDMVMQVCAY